MAENGWPVGLLAEHVISIAASNSPEELGASCHRAVGALLGSAASGLYLYGEGSASLLCSRDAPRGFLEDYARDLAHCDPMLERVARARRPVSGADFLRSRRRNVRLMQDLLKDWGFYDNLCGPIYAGSELIGFLYTAGRGAVRDDPLGRIERLEYLCRSAALSLGRLQTGAEPLLSIVGACAQPLIGAAMSPRLAEVAQLVREGRTNKEIARLLSISPHTVKEHVSSLCIRLSVRNRTGAAAALSCLGHSATQRPRTPAEFPQTEMILLSRFHDLRHVGDYF